MQLELKLFLRMKTILIVLIKCSSFYIDNNTRKLISVNIIFIKTTYKNKQIF